MFSHKRSRSVSVSGMHPRRQTRWTVLLFFIFIILFLLNRSPSSFLPFQRVQSPESVKKCPATPPWPPIVPSPSKGFNWRQIPQLFPVEQFAQLPNQPQKHNLPNVQYDFQSEERPLYGETMRARRQAAVKATFARSWKAYKERAWMKDELMPISGGSKTTFGGWGATLVDSLDALWIMDMKDEFEEAVSAVTQIDFKPEGTVNMFETTIRYLGGLLAAYDLSDCKESRLLEKAIELGDMVYASFDTPNRMPVTRWNSVKASEGKEQSAAVQGIIAEMASFSLEFTRLSQVTGDMRYYDAVKRITNVLYEQQNQTMLPGLWPVGINVHRPDLTEQNHFSLGAMADSAFEYLAKTYQLLGATGEDAAQYLTMYGAAMDATIEHLLFRPMVPDQADILMPSSIRIDASTSMSRNTSDHVGQHLVCFVGGMFALGGRLVEKESHVEIGKKVTDACIWAYRHSPNGIMPEMFEMAPCPSTSACPYDESMSFEHPGFLSVSDRRYMLRPEAIESVFYMYRITGDKYYQDVAWEMFQAIDSHSRTQYANAAIRDVMKKDGSALDKTDSMESFWLAETLKYFYLVFSDPELISLDEWVLNTEAHPFRLVR